nr:hypothetical protein Itr_chr01CG19510 [Ipomoea trifida]GMC52130.1 hypothetical protein Iba_chr01cCG12740 [Ipomoea batatas]GMC54095.1 hypothetical protein Iba_chr01dCG12910 [Ipomoea batatas]GMC54826.1 hypothetical protein Iba_chr01eCG1590 [Ipomoea batatas]
MVRTTRQMDGVSMYDHMQQLILLFWSQRTQPVASPRFIKSRSEPQKAATTASLLRQTMNQWRWKLLVAFKLLP